MLLPFSVEPELVFVIYKFAILRFCLESIFQKQNQKLIILVKTYKISTKCVQLQRHIHV